MSHSEQKVDLKTSILFDSVLRGNEIRYSDFMRFLFENNEKFISAIGVSTEKDIKVFREKKNSDIWIEEDGIPKIIIENKLQSYPTNNQLITYSKKFYKDAIVKRIKSIKEEKKDTQNGKVSVSKSDIQEFTSSIRQILLMPFDSKFYGLIDLEYSLYFDDILNSKMKVYDELEWKLQQSKNQSEQHKVSKNQAEKWSQNYVIEGIVWKMISYGEFAKKINQIPILKSQNVNDENIAALQVMKDDFVQLLENMEKIGEDLKPVDLSKSISSEFKKGEREFKHNGLIPIHKKIRASMFATELGEEVGKIKKIKYAGIRPSWNKINIGEIVISHNYSARGQNGLFEVVRKIKDDLIYIIQVEGNTLKKGLYTLIGNQKNYLKWFKEKWKIAGIDPIEFEFRKRKGGCYEYNQGNNYFYYYTKSDVKNRIVSEIFEYMKTYILKDPY